MGNNLLEAYASNPRYAEGGLEAAIDSEEISIAQEKDAQAASTAKLEDIAKPADVSQAPEVESPDKPMLDMHEKILSVVDTATGSFRDITGGMRKATENTLGLVVGRVNMDKGNNWVRENLPGLAEFTDQFEKGLAPRNTVSQVTQDMSQFMAPFGLYMKGIGALGAASKIEMGAITQTALADAITSGSALDPHVERFSALVKSMGIDNKIIGWLADNEDETESEGRLKNIIDNAGVGAALVLPFMTAAMTIKGVIRLKEGVKANGLIKPAPVSGSPKAQKGSIGYGEGPAYKDAEVFHEDIKASFLNKLPEDATSGDVMEAIAEFTPLERSVIKALERDDWLGFDYPSQAISEVFSGNIGNYEVSKGLKSAIGKLVNRGFDSTPKPKGKAIGIQKGSIGTEGDKTIYHGTDKVFDEFDLKKSADGTAWFTDNKSMIEGGEVAASGKGRILERTINEKKLKLGGYSEADKFSTDELIQQGYDGLKLIDDDQVTYQIFDPKKLGKKAAVTKKPEKTPKPSPDKELEDKMDAIINELKSL